MKGIQNITGHNRQHSSIHILEARSERDWRDGQPLRTLYALAKELGAAPNTPVAQLARPPAAGGSTPSSGPLGYTEHAPAITCVHIDNQ